MPPPKHSLFGAKWLGEDLYDMHERVVRLKVVDDTDNHHVCADCPRMAAYKVFEQEQHNNWYWCGQCDIGG
jgi:hypothetical protein